MTDQQTDQTIALRLPVAGIPINVGGWGRVMERLEQWAAAKVGRYVCLCNVHSIVTASQDPRFAELLAGADMATPDGAPVAWMLRRQGATDQPRISGPDLMLRYCAGAAERGEPIFLYGSTPETLQTLQRRLLQRFPGLQVAGAHSPPFRPLTRREDQAVVDLINASGARTVWVSLGCPKQEQWMADHRDRIHAVLLGVGAAFDFHAGTLRRAPGWMQSGGLEWLYRLLCEPRRLWRRYLRTNSLFIYLTARQLVRSR